MFIESSASEANRNQDPASCQESSPRITLIGVNHDSKITEDQGCSGGTAAAGGSASLQAVAVERGAC